MEFKRFNLFIGKNGSGKSLVLQNIVKEVSEVTDTDDPSLNEIFEKSINENINKYYTKDGKSNIVMKSNDNGVYNKYILISEDSKTDMQIDPDIDEGDMTLHHPFASLEYDEDMRSTVNKKFETIFGRKVENKYNSNNRKEAKFKKNNVLVSPQDDGHGILTALPVISFLSQKTIPDTIAIEEPTKFLHPSIIPNYLNLLMELIHKKESQLFITTHDIITALYFFKSFSNGDDNIAIFKFEDESNVISIYPINRDNYESNLSDFISPFQVETYSKFLKELSGLQYIQKNQ